MTTIHGDESTHRTPISAPSLQGDSTTTVDLDGAASGSRELVISVSGIISAMLVLGVIAVWPMLHRTITSQPQVATQQAPAPRIGEQTATVTAPPPTIYLVGSEEQRAFIQEALDLANIMRVPESPLLFSVSNVAGPGGDDVARTLASDANLLRADGRPVMTLIDLRGR